MQKHPNEYGADAFSINLEAPKSHSYKSLFEGVVGHDLEDGRRHGFVTAHKPRGREWIDLGLLECTETTYELSASYGLEGLPKPSSDVSKLTALVRTIEDAELDFSITIHALFRYEEGMDKSLINLPIKLFRPHPSVPFDTIEGVEVVRAPKGQNDPRFVLELTVNPEDKTLYHAVHATMQGTVRKGFEVEYLRLASEFSQEFLVN